MPNLRAEQRGLPLRILATPGWLSGRLHLPVKARLLDFLEHAGPFLTLTEVQLAPGDRGLPFLALQRAAVCAVVPPMGEGEIPSQESSPHQVSILLGSANVRGRLRTLPGVRVSDFLMHHKGFARLEEAHVRERPGEKDEEFPALLVNCDRIVGVAEVETLKA